MTSQSPFSAPVPPSNDSPPSASPQPIAIVGIAGRFPGARDVETFWRNLRDGRESITFFNDAELAAAGVDPAELKRPDYVKARPVLDGAEYFDATFFGVTPADAALMDPQQRVFLECAWEALENAGCDPERFDGSIGLYAGLNRNTYLLANLCTNAAFVQDLLDTKKPGFLNAMFSNEKDYATTRAAFKLNLRGPAITVQTACSTSLVAVNLACQSLLTYQCDAALAGGCSITFPQTKGYLYQEGGIDSPDGHCRAFDARAQGTVFGSGVGLVVLKRLDDALASGDQIYAVIKGTALNNDGAGKVSYTAPGVEGQVEVVQLAQALGGVHPETIGYVEAHGTGTSLGDPIEVAALTEAFRAGTERKQFCALGSVKTNVGHLDVAAGVTGLIKTALALHHREIPASLHFETPNPKLDLENTPFFVNTRLRPWEHQGTAPRRAAISSFGVGGTNAHAVLEEAPARAPSGLSRPWQLLPLSARDETALARATTRLKEHLRALADTPLADVAFTLQTGRREFAHRRAILCRTPADAIAVLDGDDAKHLLDAALPAETAREVVFMFPGQGAQYAGMTAELYQAEPVFRAELDRCAEILRPVLNLDLRELLHPTSDTIAEADARLKQTRFTQPALFAVEYSLARLWMSWGVRPAAMIGHSVGEYVAACLAGVFSLEDALRLVARRGELVESCPEGAMLAIRLPESEVRPLLTGTLDIAAINAPKLCVIAGPAAEIDAFEARLRDQGRSTVRLRTSHAFHSAMVQPAVEPLAETLRSITLNAPLIPYVSNVTARWITNEEATSPDFWARHLREPVRFADGLACLLEDSQRVLLEVGPGQTLASLARQHPAKPATMPVLTTLGSSAPRNASSESTDSELPAVLTALGQLWLAGVPIDWNAFTAHETRRRVPLPTYPFERQRHFIDAPRLLDKTWVATPSAPAVPVHSTSRTSNIAAIADAIDAELDGAPPATTATSAATTALPRRERIAQRLHKILLDLSDVDVPVTDRARSFLELGFDSLFLTLLRQEVQTAFGHRVTFRQLMDEITSINLLANHLDAVLPAEEGTSSSASDAATPGAAPLVPIGSTEPFPLTDVQREMWIACQWSPQMSCSSNDACVITLRGALDLEALRDAYAQVIARHEGFRLTFAADGATQHALPSIPAAIPLTDWSDLPETARRQQVEVAVREQMCTPFDLVNGPIVRARLLRLAPDEHIFLICGHHLVCDGWTWNLLESELGQLYAARTRGHPCTLPRPTPFSELARRISAPPEAEAYWLKQFAEVPPPLDLPLDHPRSPDHLGHAGIVEFHLENEFLQKLRTIGSRQGATLFVVVLAGLHVLLRRLANQSQTVVGICSAGRNHPGAAHCAGHFVNTLPIYSNHAGNLPFSRYLTEIKTLVQDAVAHEDFSYGRLIEKLRMPRDLGRAPLINTLLTFAPTGQIAFGDLQASEYPAAKGYANFDLLFIAREEPSALVIDVNYNRDLIDPATIERWLGHLRTLFEGVIDRPDCPLDELPMLDHGTRHQLLVEWNDTALEHPAGCLHELFESQTSRTPSAIALIDGHQRLSYAQLDRQANDIARHLRAQGVGPGAIIGIYMERTASLVAALLGVLKSGAAYLPLDPAYPPARITWMLDDSAARVVLTTSLLATALHTLGLKHAPLVVSVDTDLATTISDPATEPATPPRPRPEDLAYVIYTSGSTGLPKGVAIEHRNAVAFAHWAGLVFGPDELDGVLASTSICFDLSIFELFVTLAHGGKIILAGNALDLPSLPAAGEVRLIVSVPSIISELLRIQGIPSSVTTITLAGEPLPEEIVRRLHALPHVQKVWDLYGPTETTTYSTFALRRPGQPATIGRPIANTQVYLLDANRQPVPVGVAGELYIGGAGVARGYLNQPELTAKKFIPDPFASRPGSRLYRTGDLCRYRPDGSLEYLGRMDHQVKIRGVRIELGEVESALRAQPGLQDAVAIVREETPGDKRLVAYVTCRPGTPENPDASFTARLRAELARTLPGTMVPDVVVVLERLPLTPNGKIDRKALPAPSTAHIAPTDSAADVPLTATEETLAVFWCEVLGCAHVRPNDNFFELGGHSLLAMRLAARVREALQIDLSLRTVLQHPTLSAMAAMVEQLLLTDIENTAPSGRMSV